MFLGKGGISTQRPFPDPPLPPPPVWRSTQRTESLGLKVNWSDEGGGGGGPSPRNSESMDLLQTVQLEPGSGLEHRDKAEVIYAVKEPYTSGAPSSSGRRRMRLVLLPEDDEPDVEEECETRLCDHEFFYRRSTDAPCSGWLHSASAPKSYPDANDPERVTDGVVSEAPVNRTSFSLALGSRFGCQQRLSWKEGRFSPPNRRRLRDCCSAIPWFCLRSQTRPDPSLDSHRKILYPSSSGGIRSGDSPLRGTGLLRDAERTGQVCRLHRRRGADVRRFSAPVIFLFIFIGIALAAVGVAVGFILINTNLLQKHLPGEHSEAIESQVNHDASNYVTVISSLEKPTRDDEGWVYYSKGSINGSKYLAFHKAMTYSAAQEHCKRFDGYLARINTIREQVFIEDYIQQELSVEGGADGGVGFWIGARRARGSHGDTCMFDQWKWIDAYGRAHGAISGFTAFIPGKPDNYYSPEECLFLSYRDKNQPDRYLKWDDAPCDLDSMGGIKVLCEVELLR